MSLSSSPLRVLTRASLPHRITSAALVLAAAAALSSALPGVARAQIPALPTGPTAGCPTTASAATAPFLRLFVNGVCTDLSSFFIPSTSTPGIWNLATTLHLTDATVDLTAQVKRDPFITFSAATTNLTPGTMTYAFLFGTPVTPGLYTSASSSGSASIAPGAAQHTTVSPDDVYPAMIGGYGTDGPYATNLNVNVGTTACVVTGTTTSSCALGTNSSAFSPTYFDNLEAVLTYNQDDLNSSAGIAGRIDLNLATATTVTPEPGTLSLVATGLIGFAGVLRKRRRLVH